MATVKQRVHRMNESGSYDTVYYETSSEVVIRPDGTTVEQTVSDLITELDTLGAQIDGKVDASDIASITIWNKYLYSAAYKTQTVFQPSGSALNYFILMQNVGGVYGSYYSNYMEFKYSSSVTVDDNGEVSLVNPSTTRIYKSNGNSGTGYTYLFGKYFQYSSKENSLVISDFGDGKVYYFPSNTSIDLTKMSYGIATNKVIEIVTGVSSKEASESNGLLEQISNADSNAYPDEGKLGNYFYVKNGTVGQKAKIQTGSYFGTGTYGSSNPNSLTFTFVPKVLFIANTSNETGGEISIPYGGAAALSVGTRLLNFSWTQNTVSWYSIDAAQYQLNNSGNTYTYVAIG